MFVNFDEENTTVVPPTDEVASTEEETTPTEETPAEETPATEEAPQA